MAEHYGKNVIGSGFCPCSLAGYYMHPAVADASLHISAIPAAATLSPTPGRIPISLATLAAPERRNAVLRAPWAATASRGDFTAGGSVTGDATAAESLPPGDWQGTQNQLRFRGLVSRAVASSPSSYKPSVASPKAQVKSLATPL